MHKASSAKLHVWINQANEKNALFTWLISILKGLDHEGAVAAKQAACQVSLVMITNKESKHIQLVAEQS